MTHRRPLVAPALLVVLAAGPASAQLVPPTIARSTIPTDFQQLSIAEIEADAAITLSFTISVFSVGETFEYELTYDVPRSETQNADLIDIDLSPTNKRQGVVESGVNVSFRILPSQIVPAAQLPGGGEEQDNGERKIVLRAFRSANPFDTTTIATANWTFRYDTKTPPVPVIGAVTGGEARIGIDFSVSDTDDVEGYELAWRPAIPGGTSDPDACDETAGGLTADALTRQQGGIQKTATSAAVESDDLRVGECAAIAIRSYDAVGNRSAYSELRGGVPREVLDYFELHRQAGGGEDGGFCFLATAAYGSYAHPAVRLLRGFRDVVLMTGPIGRELVGLYYRVSPPLAAEVRAHPALAAWLRLELWPVALLGAAAAGSPALLLVLLALSRRRALALPVVFAALAVSPPARAGFFDELGVGLELRGGPFLPDMGDPASASLDPAFGTAFGTEEEPVGERLLFAAEVDLVLYRGVGSAGIGASAGFMRFVGSGRYTGEASEVASDTTTLHLVPTALVVFYRFDWLAYERSIPIVPFVKGGLAYTFWWVTDGRGDLAEVGDDDGAGGKLGLTASAGLGLLLNDLEPRAAKALEESVGVRGTSLFFEWQVRAVDGFGDGGFDLSESNWNAGLHFDF